MRTKYQQAHNPSYPHPGQQSMQQPQHYQFPQHQRAGDWKCVVCSNINFSFRNECNRCGLISKEQNDHHNTMIAYGGVEAAGLPYFLTPIRRKDKEDNADRSPGYVPEPGKNGGLLSVSPVLRQLGL